VRPVFCKNFSLQNLFAVFVQVHIQVANAHPIRYSERWPLSSRDCCGSMLRMPLRSCSRVCRKWGKVGRFPTLTLSSLWSEKGRVLWSAG